MAQDVTITGEDGVTSAHLAASLGLLSTLIILIDKAPILLKTIDCHGNTMLDYAKFGGYKNCISLLEKALDIVPLVLEVSEEKALAKTAVQLQRQSTAIREEEDVYSFVQKELHKYYQMQKLVGNTLINDDNIESWVIGSTIFSRALILNKFNNAILNGFVGKYGKAGVKDIDHNLYELKILSSICGDLRLYTTKE